MNLSIDWLLLSVLLYLILIPFLRLLVRGRSKWDYFEPVNIFLLLFFVGFFLKGILILHDDRFFILNHLNADRKFFSLSLLTANIGLVAFYVGYFSRIPRWIATRLPRLPVKLNRRKTGGAIVCLFFAGLAGYLEVMVSVGGPVELLQKAFFERTIYFGRGWLVYNVLFLWLSLALYLMYAKKGGRPFYRCLAFYLLFPAVLLVTVSLGNRYFVVSLFILILLFCHYEHRRLNMAALSMTAVILLAGLMVSFRIRQPAMFEELGIQDTLLLSIATAFQIVDNFAIVLEYIPEYHDFFWGRVEYESVVYGNFYPRALFPDKPVVWGRDLIQSVYMPELRFVGFSVSIFGPSYADFGWPGVIVSMVLLGIVSRALYMRLAADKFSGSYFVMNCFFVTSSYLILADGMSTFLAHLPQYVLMAGVLKGIGWRDVRNSVGDASV